MPFAVGDSFIAVERYGTGEVQLRLIPALNVTNWRFQPNSRGRLVMTSLVELVQVHEKYLVLKEWTQEHMRLICIAEKEEYLAQPKG